MLRFSDGVKVDTSGDYRVVKLKDGFYVVGHGAMIPVDDRQEGLETIKDLKK